MSAIAGRKAIGVGAHGVAPFNVTLAESNHGKS
jgi:hypothetical protein